jgi:hypothetical protein
VLRNLANVQDGGTPLPSAGSISSHTRPVECLAAGPADVGAKSVTLFTADTMGVVRAWTVTLEEEASSGGAAPRWTASLAAELNPHRTGVTELWYGGGLVYTGRHSSLSTLILGSEPVHVRC